MRNTLIQKSAPGRSAKGGPALVGRMPPNAPHGIFLLFFGTAACVHHTHTGIEIFEAMSHGATWTLIFIVGCWLIGLAHEASYFVRKVAAVIKRDAKH